MSNGTKEQKPYFKIIILAIIIMTAMSIGIFMIEQNVQKSKIEYTRASEEFNNLLNYVEFDIQSILQDDGTKYGTSYSYLQDLYILSNLYTQMEEYNITNPGNYTQQDFDEIEMEFASTLRQLIFVIQSTWVYQYVTNVLGANVENNYTYRAQKYFLIWNKWDSSSEPIHANIKDYVNSSFTLAGDTVELPEIKWQQWTENLYGNLSILEFTGYQNGISYGRTIKEDLNLVNLSLNDLGFIINQYSALSEKASQIVGDFNNTLITIATSAVILAFAVSFDNKKHVRLTLLIGIIVLFLSIIYLISATSTFYSLSDSAIINYLTP